MATPHTQPAISSPRTEPERRFVLHDVPWETYEGLSELYRDRAGPRMTYCEGTLELMSPGAEHEDTKKTLARLIEAYADELGLPLVGYGSLTVRKREHQRGLEPDECYVLGRLVDDRPDLAIEVVYTTPLLDKLDVYARLGVPEVWVWEHQQITVRELGPQGYVIAPRSRMLPELDLARLAEIAESDAPQWEKVRQLRAWIGSRPGR